MAYVTAAELAFAMSQASFDTVFDQDNDGVADDAVVDAALARASALTDAWIAPVYRGPFPIVAIPIPSMVRELTIQFALAMAFERRPDYTRTLQGGADNDKERWARAEATGERLQKAILRIVEMNPPANVGGQVRAGGTSIAGVEDPRFFDNMGRFF